MEELKVFDLSLDKQQTFQLVCRYLLAGKTIYYSDSVNSRVGEFYSTIRQDNFHEYGKTLYTFIQSNFSEIKRIMNHMGYQLNRGEHTLSIQPVYRYFFYLDLLDLEMRIKEEKYQSLLTGDSLILSALILETNNGTQFIEYKQDFLNKLLEEPEKILKTNVDLAQVARIVMPQAQKIGNDEYTRDRLQKRIDERVKKHLRPLNFVQIIQNDQKISLISLGPSAFRFIHMLRTLNSPKGDIII